MSADRVKKFIQENVTRKTYMMLRNYKQYGLYSRTFMINENEETLDNLEKTNSQFPSEKDKYNTYLESRIYLHRFVTLCILIEDFCSLLYALSKPLEDFPRNILSQPNPKNILKKLDSNYWCKILRYSSLDKLSMNTGDTEFLKNVRERNLERLTGFISIISNFLELYWVGYSKYKHANTFLYGFNIGNFFGERTLILPYIYNAKNPSDARPLVITPTVYSAWKGIFGFLYEITEDILDRSLKYIETGGHHFLEDKIYFEMSDNSWNKFERLATEFSEDIPRDTFHLSLNASSNEDSLKKHMELVARFQSWQKQWEST